MQSKTKGARNVLYFFDFLIYTPLHILHFLLRVHWREILHQARAMNVLSQYQWLSKNMLNFEFSIATLGQNESGCAMVI